MSASSPKSAQASGHKVGGSHYPVVRLRAERESSLKRFHPWVFSGALGDFEKGIELGDLVTVRSSRDEFLGIGYTCSQSIAIKILSFTNQPIDAQFWDDRVSTACRARDVLQLGHDTTGYRLIHGEGDGIPGLIVDRYDGTLVVQCHAAGILKQLPLIVEALRKLPGIDTIYHKSTDSIIEEERPADLRDQFILGEASSRIFQEHGIRFEADYVRGQKTGFFLDQRESRALLRSLSQGKCVLNTFCYTGGFSLAALCGGAKRVVSVDSSELALEQLASNLALNSFAGTHDSVKDDVMKYFPAHEERYEIIVVDPPAFAKHRGAVEQGVKGYRRLNQMAMERLTPGGLLFTFSCSQLVDRELFRKAIFQAAAQSRKNVRVLFELRQAPCHPVSLYHPEGEYLKGLVLSVE